MLYGLMKTTTSVSYTRTAIILHWLIAIIIIGQLIGGKVMMAIDPSPTKFELFQLHKSFGITILLLSLMRLGWRLTHKAPPLPYGMKAWEAFVAKATHWLFYTMIIGIPISGWIMTSASTPKITTKLFKVIPWPDFPGIPRTETLENVFKDIHENMAIFIFILIVLHIGAALKHHFVNKDGVLARMIPFLNRS